MTFSKDLRSKAEIESGVDLCDSATVLENGDMKLLTVRTNLNFRVCSQTVCER